MVMVTIELHEFRSVVVRWTRPAPEKAYTIRVEYFHPSSAMIEPFSVEEKEAAAHQAAKEFMLPGGATDRNGLRACTVRVLVRPIGSPERGDHVAQRQTTWDSKYLSFDLGQHHNLLSESLEEFSRKRGKKEVTILVVGGQHHGKSSFLNHLWRCAKGKLDAPDQVSTAPEGATEKTVETKRLRISFQGQYDFNLIDTPAFATLNGDLSKAFEAMLIAGFPDGTHRCDLKDHMLRYKKPADAAIIVVSLTHWVSGGSAELKLYLKKMAEMLQTSAGGKVCFPFAVALTKRDEFLKDTQAENPYKELRQIVMEVQEAANTDHVYTVANVMMDSTSSSEVNSETFGLLRNIVSFAKGTETDKCSKGRLRWTRAGVTMLGAAAGAGVGAVAAPVAGVGVGVAGLLGAFGAIRPGN